MSNTKKSIALFEQSLLKNVAERLVRGNIRMQRGSFDTPTSWQEKQKQHAKKLKHVSHLLYPEKF